MKISQLTQKHVGRFFFLHSSMFGQTYVSGPVPICISRLFTTGTVRVCYFNRFGNLEVGWVSASNGIYGDIELEELKPIIIEQPSKDLCSDESRADTCLLVYLPTKRPAIYAGDKIPCLARIIAVNYVHHADKPFISYDNVQALTQEGYPSTDRVVESVYNNPLVMSYEEYSRVNSPLLSLDDELRAIPTQGTTW